jgi:hypothetical protein
MITAAAIARVSLSKNPLSAASGSDDWPIDTS